MCCKAAFVLLKPPIFRVHDTQKKEPRRSGAKLGISWFRGLGSSPWSGPLPTVGGDVLPLPQPKPPVIDYRHRLHEGTCLTHGLPPFRLGKARRACHPFDGLPAEVLVSSLWSSGWTGRMARIRDAPHGEYRIPRRCARVRSRMASIVAIDDPQAPKMRGVDLRRQRQALVAVEDFKPALERYENTWIYQYSAHTRLP